TLGRLEARADSLVLTQAERAGSRLLTDLQATKLARAVVSRRQLQEVMVDFWENHFSVHSAKGPERYLLLPFDRDVIRPLALRRFVSDTPPGGLVKRAARTFRDSDGDIRAVLRTIFSSREFSSRAAYRAKIKSPFELVASALRGLGAAADTTPRTVQLVAQLGEPLYGHDAPNGYPETGAPWLGSGALLSRINLGLALAAGQVPGVAVS